MEIDFQNNIIAPLFTGLVVMILGLIIEHTFFPSGQENIANHVYDSGKIDDSFNSQDYNIDNMLRGDNDFKLKEKPKIGFLPSAYRLSHYHWFARTLGWLFFIASIFLAFFTAFRISENAGCLLSLGAYVLTTAVFIIIFRFIGIKLTLFSLIYMVYLYECLANWIYGAI